MELACLCVSSQAAHAAAVFAAARLTDQLRTAVQVAVACIKVSSQAVKAMPTLLLFPLLPFVCTVLLFAYWVAVAAFLYSAGTIAPQYLATTQLQPMTLGVRIPLPRPPLLEGS